MQLLDRLVALDARPWTSAPRPKETPHLPPFFADCDSMYAYVGQVEIENGQVARGMVHSLDEAATWLHEQMLVHFPDSLYAQTARGEIRQALTPSRVY